MDERIFRSPATHQPDQEPRKHHDDTGRSSSTQISISGASTPTSHLSFSYSNSSVLLNISPSPDHVTSKPILTTLARVVAVLMQDSVTDRIARELYWIVRLFMCNDTYFRKLPPNADSATPESMKDLFGSIHNTVHFASVVISSTHQYICLLGRQSITSMIENERVHVWMGDVIPLLTAALRDIDSRPPITSKTHVLSDMIEPLATLQSNDAVLTSPLKLAPVNHPLEKARDALYAMCESHEADQGKGTFEFRRELSVFRSQLDPALMEGLALIIVQLFCEKMGPQTASGLDGSLSAGDMGMLKKSNPDKLKLLASRFSSSSNTDASINVHKFSFFETLLFEWDSFVLTTHVLRFVIRHIDDIERSLGTSDLVQSIAILKHLARFAGCIMFRPSTAVKSATQTERANSHSAPFVDSIEIKSRLLHAWRMGFFPLRALWLMDAFTQIKASASVITQPGLADIVQLLRAAWRKSTEISFSSKAAFLSRIIIEQTFEVLAISPRPISVSKYINIRTSLWLTGVHRCS